MVQNSSYNDLWICKKLCRCELVCYSAWFHSPGVDHLLLTNHPLPIEHNLENIGTNYFFSEKS